MDADEILDAWCTKFDRAWKGPGRAPNIGFNDMEYRPDRLEIVYVGNQAPHPFHMGFKLGNTAETSGADGAAIMLDVLHGGALVADARDKRESVAALCETSKMSVVSWHVCAVSKNKEVLTATIYVAVEALNASGVMQSHDFIVGEGWGFRGMDEIRKLARTQDARRKVGAAPLLIDPILLRVIRAMPRREVEKLIAHLRRHPTVPKEEMGFAMQPSWDRSSLARHGCSLPKEVETAVVKKGVVCGRVRLAPGTTWHAGTLIHAAGVPESLAIGMSGRKLVDLVDHPDIDPRLVVDKAVIDARGALRVKTKPLLEDFEA